MPFGAIIAVVHSSGAIKLRNWKKFDTRVEDLAKSGMERQKEVDGHGMSWFVMNSSCHLVGVVLNQMTSQRP